MRQSFKQRKAALLAVQKKAVGKIRIRKAERESYVFITKSGKRVGPRTREKVFAVYVTRNGKKRVLRPKDIGGLSGLKPHRIATIQVTEALPRKRASRKYAAGFGARFSEQQILTVRAGNGKRVLDYDIAARKFSKYLSETLNDLDPRSKRVFIIEVAATIRLPDGALKTINTIPVEFGAAFLQQYSRKDLLAFARNKIWAVLGNELDIGFYVSTGSATFIRRRGYNRGKEPKDWQQRLTKGELVLWRYASDYDQREKVQLKQIDYKVTLE